MVYVAINTVPYVQVMAAASGNVLWRRPASFGAAATGLTVNPTVVKGRVAYVRPDDDSTRGHLVVADPFTGADLSVGRDDLWFTERPFECAARVCFSGSVPDGAEKHYRADVPSGHTVVDNSRLLTGARILGSAGIQSSQATGHPEMLARRLGGRTYWQRTVVSLFGLNYTSNRGWSVRTFDKQNVAVVELGYDAGAATPVNLVKTQKLVGLNLKTGARIWSQAGTDRTCLPRGGDTAEDDHLATVRCRWGSGATAVVTADGYRFRSAPVSLEGFDPATGRTTWSVPLVDARGKSWDDWAASIRLADGNALIASGPRGTISIDPATGRSRPASPDQQGVCEHWIETPIWNSSWDDDGSIRNTHTTGISYSSCDLAGAAGAPVKAWPSWAGVDVGSTHVVTTPRGLIGTRLMVGPDPKAGTAMAIHPTGPTPAPPASVPSSGRPPTLAWTSTQTDVPLTQPISAGQVVVLYARTSAGLTLEGVDPLDGKVRWRQRASAGTFGLFSSIPPTVVGTRVLYPRPEPGSDSHSVVMVVADATSGRDIHVSSGGYWLRDWPRTCGVDACFTAYNSDGMYAMRVDLTTGFVAQDPPFDGSPQVGAGSDLVEIGPTPDGDAKMATLAAMDTNAIRFRVPAGRIVPAGYVTDPISFSFWPTSGVYVGEFAQDLASSPRRNPLGTKAPMAAIDVRTGSKLWSTTGTDTSCLPWPMRAAPRYPVRCRWSRNASEVYTNGQWTYRSASVQMEGFDPKSGAASWKVPLGRLTGEVDTISWAAGDHTVLTTGRNGSILIDLGNGTTGPAGSAQPRYCSKGVTSALGLTRKINGVNQSDVWATGTAWDLCAPSGRPVAQSRPWPGWVGAQVGGMRVVLTGNGLRGYRQD